MSNTVPKTENPHAVFSQRGLDDRLDGIVLETLEVFLPGLVALYGVAGAAYIVLLWDEPMQALVLSAAAFLSGGMHFRLRTELRSGRVAPAMAHVAGAAVAGLALLNSFLHLVLVSEPASTTAIILIVMAAGCTFLSTRWLAAVLGASLTAWSVGFLLAPRGNEWGQFGAALALATAVAVVAFVRRMRSYEDLHSEHLSEHKFLEERHLAELEHLYVKSEHDAGVLAAHREIDGLWEWDLRIDRLHFSSRWKTMMGYGDGEVDPTPEAWFNLIHPHDLPTLMERLRAHLDGQTDPLECEHRMQQADGEYRWVLTRGLVIRSPEGEAERMVGSLVDLKRMKSFEERLVHNTTHDRLTNLPNREHLFDRLQEEMDRKRRSGNYLFAVMFLDLDRFKDINDSLGHFVGDQLLAAVAGRLKQCTREWDVVARLGVDEFVVLLRRLQDEQQAIDIASRIQSSLGSTFELDRQEIVTSASIGIALSTSTFESPEELLRNADIAMYRAKGRGKGQFQIFDSDMHVRVARVWNLQSDLRKAVEHDQLVLHYQPFISLKTARISGAEALVRWRRSSGELVSPKEFIPIAEELGLVLDIGKWVLEEACRQNKTWQDEGLRKVRISVNLSARQLGSPELLQTIKQTLAATKLDPRWLQLEITETVLMGTIDATPASLDGIRRLGIRTAIDDFGTGYSSLSYLRKLQCDTLKIDRSFVADISSDRKAAALAQSMITMAHGLQLSVVAEGVETQNQLAFLKRYGCDQMQGYLASRPVSAEEFSWMLKQDSRFLGETDYPSRPKSDPGLAKDLPGEVVSTSESLLAAQLTAVESPSGVKS